MNAFMGGNPGARKEVKEVFFAYDEVAFVQQYLSDDRWPQKAREKGTLLVVKKIEIGRAHV